MIKRLILKRLLAGQALLLLVLPLMTGAWSGVREERVEEPKTVPVTVGVVNEQSLTALLGKTREGTVIEIVFRRLPETQVLNRKWEQIVQGDRIQIQYTEVYRIREGRNERGVFDRESTLMDRKLDAVIYPPPEKKKLVSGL